MQNPTEPAREVGVGSLEPPGASPDRKERRPAGAPPLADAWQLLMIRRGRRPDVAAAGVRAGRPAGGARAAAPQVPALLRGRPEWDPEEEIRSTLTVLRGLLQLLGRPESALPPEMRRLVESSRAAERELERTLLLLRQVIREVAASGEEPSAPADAWEPEERRA